MKRLGKKLCIGFFSTTPEEEAELKKRLKGFKTEFYGEPNLESAAKARNCYAVSCFALAKTRFDSKLLDLMPKVKLITTRSTGFDHIDIAECRKRGITVCNVPTYGENTVAEHSFALLLALSRKIVEAHERVQKGDFGVQGLTGFDLAGKTIGIIGTGKIGSRVAAIAKGFKMNILAFDSRKNPELERDCGAKYVTLAVLLKNSDVVSIHLPLNDKTRHLINRKNLRLAKKGAILINTARGGIVETGALIEAIAKGTLSGAGLDVLEEEGLVKDEDEILKAIRSNDGKFLKIMLQDKILLSTRKVLITPHIAFNSKEALERITQTTVENIKAFAGGKPQNKI